MATLLLSVMAAFAAAAPARPAPRGSIIKVNALNRYGFGEGDPINKSDPIGEDALGCGLDLAGAFASAVGFVGSLAAEPGTGGLSTVGVISSLSGAAITGVAIKRDCPNA